MIKLDKCSCCKSRLPVIGKKTCEKCNNRGKKFYKEMNDPNKCKLCKSHKKDHEMLNKKGNRKLKTCVDCRERIKICRHNRVNLNNDDKSNTKACSICAKVYDIATYKKGNRYLKTCVNCRENSKVRAKFRTIATKQS